MSVAGILFLSFMGFLLLKCTYCFKFRSILNYSDARGRIAIRFTSHEIYTSIGKFTLLAIPFLY